jgi:formate--tetrahydrofolate ligase
MDGGEKEEGRRVVTPPATEAMRDALYGGEGVNIAPGTAAKLTKYEETGHGHLPVCVAKTQSSLSDDPMKLGRPRDFKVFIRDAKLAAGDGFVVACAGDIMTMPGLPKKPAAETMDIDGQGGVHGLF